jgi:hypothetical protein
MAEDRITTAFFNASVRYNLGDGSSSLFWLDPWLQRQRLTNFAPDLVAAVPARCKKRRTVVQALQGIAWASDITGALTVPVFVQFVLLHQRLQEVQLSLGVPDQLQL